MKKPERAKLILDTLEKLFPKTKVELHFGNNWELVVAVVLSAQCTDKQVNKVTKKLFKKYPRLIDYVRADRKEFERDIHSTGFFRSKTKNILDAAKLVHEIYKGKVPKTMEDLLKLPGVGRKTANVILATAFGKAEGIAVDTHVKRLAKKYGLTKHTNPEKIEQDLMKVFPRNKWKRVTTLFIDYGRAYCPARKHHHENCPLVKALHEAKRK